MRSRCSTTFRRSSRGRRNSSSAARRSANGANANWRQAADDSKRSKELLRSGLRRFREAGVAFERLAALRFATANYPNDLWDSADCFYLGHSYTSAARLLDVYLQE